MLTITIAELYEAADDSEATLLDGLLQKIGKTWQCRSVPPGGGFLCRWVNPVGSPCEKCGHAQNGSLAPAVGAEVHSDDYRFEVAFDASAYLAALADEEISQLAAEGWGGNYAADQVAQFYEDSNGEIGELFSYVQRADVGFECYVEEADALRWLKIHRPGLHAALTTEN